MNFTPRPDLPEPLVKALTQSNEQYAEELSQHLQGVEEDFDFQISVTSLNRSPRQLQLTKRHWNDVTVDPLKESYFTLQGNIIHYILEKCAAGDRYIRETRLGVVIEVDGVKVYFHGQLDLYDKETETLTDWKYTSANAMLYPSEDYVYQLNSLRWLAYKSGEFPYKIKELQNVYLFRHIDKKWQANPLYPQENAQVKKVEQKTRYEIEEWIKDRIRIHLNERNKPDDQLAYCTDDERWIRDSEWRLYTKTVKGDRFKKTATAKGKKEEVELFIKQNNLAPQSYQLQEFKGAPIKCRAYCLGRDFCSQYKEEKDNHED